MKLIRQGRPEQSVVVKAALLMKHPTTGTELLHSLYPEWEYAQYAADEHNAWDAAHGHDQYDPRFRVEDAGFWLSEQRET